ncbi:MAG: 4-(cytidine 5'-diphospho)-2-C-methyl-D-erythritol kinase [Planctomycetia bacterium]|nr:4-(cytidine 5'-diphospho)-2-C-methyl-D-erythritol kinase [Planctomycetia bacterium]
MKSNIIQNGLIIQTPAKLNLFFEVLHKRSDNYHEIETITTLIDLYDELRITKQNSDKNFKIRDKNSRIISESNPKIDKIDFRCQDSNGLELDLGIPKNEKNLVLKAVELFQKKTGRIEPLSIQLIKRIPSQAGLGGGSSDAAATLWGLNKLFQTQLSQPDLQELGAKLGSDVPLFLVDSGIVLGKGRGEIVKSLDNIQESYFVLLKPPLGLSTAAVYAQSEKIRNSEKYQIKKANSLLNESQTGLSDNWPSLIFNRLEEAASLIWENIEKIKKKMKLLNVLGVQMTGSGSCLFAICPNRETANQIAFLLKLENMGQIIVAKSCSQ